MKQLNLRLLNLFYLLFLNSSAVYAQAHDHEHMNMTPSDNMPMTQSMDHNANDQIKKSTPQAKPQSINKTTKPMHHHGMYGLYPMTRESSGTSWQPQSTPFVGMMVMKDKSMYMLQGFLNLIYDNQGGLRGDDLTFSTNMLMFMAQKDTDAGTFGFRSMLSLDSAMGKGGYPLLLQTGETANGKTPLIDRQHPHDAFMELAGTYSYPFSEKQSAYLYLGLPGEPALGPPDLMMRWSSMYIPEAPITHHWLDSTHVTFGVVTLGYIFNNVKLEASAFNGREPDQYRWNIESPKLNSGSARITFNPNDNWSIQASYGYLKSPEILHPQVNTNRTTISAIYNQPFGCDNNWQTTLAWGKNANHPGNTLNGYLLESAVNVNSYHTFFGRLEHVQKDELFESPSPLEGEIFTVNKLSVGYLYQFSDWFHLKPGIGGLISTYNLPSKIESAYGSNPFSYMLFARVEIV